MPTIAPRHACGKGHLPLVVSLVTPPWSSQLPDFGMWKWKCAELLSETQARPFTQRGGGMSGSDWTKTGTLRCTLHDRQAPHTPIQLHPAPDSPQGAKRLWHSRAKPG